MRMLKFACIGAGLCSILCGAAWAGDDGKYVAPSKGTFTLAAYPGQDQNQNKGTVVKESTKVTTMTKSEGRGNITGDIAVRSTDPEEVGELEWKNFFGWSTTKNGGSDDFEYEFELEYGLMENHELIFEVPVELGDGRVDGNGDITLGWHWKLSDGEGAMPSLGMRNFVRIPTGDGSEGVDYEWRGLMTWILSDTARFHLNPLVRSVNGENDGTDARHFRWGVIAGMDYDLSDDFKLIWDYIYENSVTEHHRDDHTFQAGFDWKFAENQTLSLVGSVSLDGDGNDNASFGMNLGYTISFGG